MNDQNPQFDSDDQTPEAELCPADKAAFDALIEAGMDPARLEGDVRRRAERMMSAFRALDAYPVPPEIGATAVDRVMAKIGGDKPLRLEPPPTEMRAQPMRLRLMDWRNGFAAAAAILVIAAIFIPMVSSGRSLELRTTCMSNFSQAGLAMGLYSQANDGLLAVRYDTAPDNDWLSNRTNSANLFYLAKTGYAAFSDLACPGNPHVPDDATLASLDNWPSLEATSFSYQHMIAVPTPRLETHPTLVIMADRSPLVDAAHRGQSARFDAASIAHGRAGQNTLLNDGSSQWIEHAWYFKDNIWLPKSCHGSVTYQLVGDEVPFDEYDTMLTH